MPFDADVQKSFPNLPGFRNNKDILSPKKQGFKMMHGMMVETAAIPPSPTRTLGMSQSTSGLLRTRDMSSLSIAGGIVSGSKPSPSKWIQNANTVLSFDAYFKEAVNESSIKGENYRVRKCIIYYYCEDDTIHVVESKQENSGVPQGNFVKRHQIPKDTNSGTYFVLDDFYMNAVLSIYGRNFILVGCNGSTEKYMANVAGRPVGPQPGFPDDPYEKLRADFMLRETGKDFSVARNCQKNPMKKFMEATLGNTVNNKGRSGFEQYDRVVLRFTAMWDDRGSMFGDLQSYTLHYFLADNTVEVLEVPKPNSGRDPFPKLLSRQQLARNWNTENANGRDDEYSDKQFYQWQDFMVGKMVHVFGRDLHVIDADSSTRQWCAAQGFPLAENCPLQANVERKVPDATFPEYNGWGNELDSLASCKSLVPKAPRTPFDIQGPALSKRVLRFKAKMVTNHPDDVARQFVIQFFIEDNTMSVREPPQRNSGVIGGNFLARKAWKNPRSGLAYEQSSFAVGSEVAFDTGTGLPQRFEITDVDEATLNYMESKPENFPLSDIKLVLEALRKKLLTQTKSNQLFTLFRKYDKDFSGTITLDEFKTMMKQYDADMSDQMIITLMRFFDSSGDGMVTLDEFTRKVTGGGEIKDADEWQSDSFNYEEYTKVAQGEKQKELEGIKQDTLLAQFTDLFLNRGTASETLRKLDRGGNGFLSRSDFIEGISASASSDDSISLNIYFPYADACLLADAFFGKDSSGDAQIAYKDFTQKAANLNASSGNSHAALHAEGLGWTQQQD
jgi:Ca2+-binding EF-hand superfamily protein